MVVSKILWRTQTQIYNRINPLTSSEISLLCFIMVVFLKINKIKHTRISTFHITVKKVLVSRPRCEQKHWVTRVAAGWQFLNKSKIWNKNVTRSLAGSPTWALLAPARIAIRAILYTRLVGTEKMSIIKDKGFGLFLNDSSGRVPNRIKTQRNSREFASYSSVLKCFICLSGLGLLCF